MRVAGIVFVKIDGNQIKVKANVSYGLGTEKREAIVGHDSVHGYKTTPQVAFVEGELTDAPNFDLKKFFLIEKATITVQLANGKTIVLKDAWFAGEGTGSSEEAAIPFRFESASEAEEIR